MPTKGIFAVLTIVFSEGLVLHGPSSPLHGQLGGDLELPCSVSEPIPLDELEVEWRRTESRTLVHLFQGGESRPESQSVEYRDRALFFTTSEMAKGNYSLLLHNVTVDDIGRYSCSAFTNEESSELTVDIETIERLVVTGAEHAVSANVGQEVILDCLVDSHIPPEEVSWKKVDSDESLMLVLLFQDNETHPGHGSYQGRAELFSTEIPKGNFSLRLRDVRTEDQGEYICEAYSDHLSANTTVKLQELGLSFKHILVLVLCCFAIIVALVVSVMILKDIRADIGPCALKMHYSLVLLPSATMFTAFVLWGVIEGFLSEVVTCSSLNLIRFILLFKISLYHEQLPDMVKTITKTGFDMEYLIIASVVYYVIVYDLWSREGESKAMAFMSTMFGSSIHMAIQGFFAGGGGYLDMMDMFLVFTMSFLSRTFNQNAFIGMFIGSVFIPLSDWLIVGFIVGKRYPFLEKSELFLLGYMGFLFLRRLLLSVMVLYFFLQFLENNKERDGLLSVVVLFQLLSLAGVLDVFNHPALAETPKVILYLYGAVGVLAVNGVTLATELMLKSRNGQRIVTDLRVVVLPFECGFVLGWIILWSHAYWKERRERIKTEVTVCQQYGCGLWVQVLKDEDYPHEVFKSRLGPPSSIPPSAGSSTSQEDLEEPSPEAETEIDAPEDRESISTEQGQEKDLRLPTSSERTDDDQQVQTNAAEDRHATGPPVSLAIHISGTDSSEMDSLLHNTQCEEQREAESGDSSADEGSTLLEKDICEGVSPSH